MQDAEVIKTKTPKNTSSPKIVSSFHDINLPTEERYFLQSLVENMRGLLRKRGSSGFFADNLISIGKNLGFMKDTNFVNSVKNSVRDEGDLHKIWRLHIYCWASKMCMNLQGDFVECGVYKGLYVDSTIQYLGSKAFNGREFYLYDTFYGLEPKYSTEIELQWINANKNTDYSEKELEAAVRKRFSKYPFVKVIKGIIPDILNTNSPKSIAFLHLDLNAGIAETKALDILYERVEKNGIILLDDYGRFEHMELFNAHNEWFKKNNQSILELPTGQGLVIKK